MAENDRQRKGNLVYDVDEKPRSARDYALYSLQWLVTMFYGVVWGYALVGIGLGFEGEDLTRYMSAVVLTIGVATLLQAWLGHRFAMVSGPNVIPSLAIVAAATTGGMEYALQSFTAQAIAGVLLMALALVGLLNLIRRIWSPLILGAMVLMVGLAIAEQGLELLIEAGFAWPFWVGAALALGGSVVAIRGTGVWATLPPLFVIGLGYLIFMLFGDFEWELITEAPLFVLPAPFPYGLAWPPLDLIVIMFVVNLMAALNLYGNVTGYAEVVHEEVAETKTKRFFTVFGAAETALSGILGAPATVPYGENLGIVMLTRVAARVFIIVASLGFIVLAFLGPMGGLMAAMPGPVAGAVLLGIASTAVGIGVNIMTQVPAFGRREQTLVGFSVFLSLGLFLLPEEAWEAAPRLVSTIFGNPIISVILFVMLFEQAIFRGTGDDATEEEAGMEENEDREMEDEESTREHTDAARTG
jgi:xanthine/uracil permease